MCVCIVRESVRVLSAKKRSGARRAVVGFCSFHAARFHVSKCLLFCVLPASFVRFLWEQLLLRRAPPPPGCFLLLLCRLGDVVYIFPNAVRTRRARGATLARYVGPSPPPLRVLPVERSGICGQTKLVRVEGVCVVGALPQSFALPHSLSLSLSVFPQQKSCCAPPQMLTWPHSC